MFERRRAIADLSAVGVACALVALEFALGAYPSFVVAQDGGVSLDAGLPAHVDGPPQPTRAEPPRGNDTRIGVGPRGGITVNGDQWIVGGYGRVDGFCIGACSRNLGFELQLLAGLGGNHMTLRASLRLDYVIWFVHEMFGIYPIVGWSVLGYVPVGKFASFCNRVDLQGCGGWETGLELGGGFRVWRFSFAVVAGVGGIPIVTIAIGLHFKLWGAAT